MSGYIVAIKDEDGAYRSYDVGQQVYVYIRQLEGYVHHPRESKLKERYPGRFNEEQSMGMHLPKDPLNVIVVLEKSDDLGNCWIETGIFSPDIKVKDVIKWARDTDDITTEIRITISRH